MIAIGEITFSGLVDPDFDPVTPQQRLDNVYK
jgi:hypothetical protein